MGRIFVNQTYLRIRLTTSVSIAGALEKKIYYKKPGGTVGSIDAEVYDVATGVIYYDLEPDSEGNADFLDETGEWCFWAKVTFADGREARGETVGVTVWDEEE